MRFLHGKKLWGRILKSVVLYFILLRTIFFHSHVIAASETLEETLVWIETLTAEVSELAFEAIATCDYYSAQSALSVIDDAAHLADELSKNVQKSADPKLAWDVYNICNQENSAIVNLMKAVKIIAHNSRDQGVIQASENLLGHCTAVQKKNETSMDTALLTFKGVVKKDLASGK